MSPAPNYTEAFAALKKIVAEIEGGAISVDLLAEKVKEASALIRICKEKLHATEADVTGILKELEEGDRRVG